MHSSSVPHDGDEVASDSALASDSDSALASDSDSDVGFASEERARIPVCVVIPTLDRPDLLAGALASVAEQTLAPAEVVVVDDGSSSDAPADVARAAGAAVVRHPVNRGPAIARNTGVAATTAEWICFLDSDDTWRPDHLETLWRQRDGALAVASAGLGTQDGRIIGYPGRTVCDLRVPRDVVFPTNQLSPSGSMVRRDAFVAAGGFRDLRTCEDLDLWLRVVEAGPLRLLPTATFAYRQHPATQATGDPGTMVAGLREVLDACRGRAWWTRSIGDAALVGHDWDELRAAVRRGELVGSARRALRLARPWRRTRHLVRLLAYRRRCRERGHELGI
jgi:glycosyltransferase involved in cell wall biosynthesis